MREYILTELEEKKVQVEKLSVTCRGYLKVMKMSLDIIASIKHFFTNR